MSNLFQSSSLSFEERLKYADLPDNIRDAVDAMLAKLAEQEEEIRLADRREEMLGEQIYFAQTLVEALDDCVKNNLPERKTGAIVEFRKAYQQIRETTMFET